MFINKIKSPAVLKKIIRRLKNRGRKIVFTNGCFDILHYGHARYLQEAKSRGDTLVVGVNSDSSVRRIKGAGRPVVKMRDRMGLLAALEPVDYVTPFSQETPLELIKLLIPDVLVKGADWGKKNIVGGNFVKSHGGKVITVKLAKGRSTTNLISRIAKKFCCEKH